MIIQELKLDKVYQFWRNLERDPQEQLRVDTRLRLIEERGLKRGQQQNHDLAIVLVKNKADSIKQICLDIELNRERAMRISQRRAEQAKNEKISLIRTVKLVKKYGSLVETAQDHYRTNQV